MTVGQLSIRVSEAYDSKLLEKDCSLPLFSLVLFVVKVGALRSLVLPFLVVLFLAIAAAGMDDG